MTRERLTRSLLFFLVFSFAFGSGIGCVQLDLDDAPPYPDRPWDYSYPDQEENPAPWIDSENYPQVTITEPANGSFVDAGTIAVRGTYAGPELASLTLNGAAITLTGSTFTGQVSVSDAASMASIMVEATTEEKGRVSADRVTVFNATPGVPGDEAIASIGLDLENRGLDAIADLLASLLDGMDLADLINPKVAADGKADTIVVHKALLEGVDLVVRSTTDGLVTKLILGSFEFDMTLFDALDINLRLTGLVADLLFGVEVDGAGEIVLSLISSDVAIASLEIENGLLDEAASYVVSLGLELLIDSLVPGLIEDLLADLDLTIMSNGFDLALVPAVAMTGDRSLSLALSSTLAITDTEIWNEDFQPEGYLSTASTAAAFPALTPNTGREYGIGIGVGDDLINQLLYGFSATDGLTFALEEEVITTEIWSVLFFAFENIDPAKQLILKFLPSAAPYAVADPETNLMSLVLPAFTAQALVDCDGDTECLADADDHGYWEAMSVAVDVTAPLSFNFFDDGSFSLKLGELDLTVDIVHNAVGQKNIDNIERLFAELFGEVLTNLFTGLSDMHIMLPELAGLNITIADMATFGDADDNLGIFIDLQ
jgi:Glucodextranase, domain B